MTSVIDMMVDVSEPRIVEIQIRSDGKVVWVNVDGICRFRACKVKKLEVQDERKG
jgi:Lon protease-like protein